MTGTQKYMQKMHAPNECLGSCRKGHESTASPPVRNAAQSACTGIHPHPAPHSCNLCIAASLRKALGLRAAAAAATAAAAAGTWGKGSWAAAGGGTWAGRGGPAGLGSRPRGTYFPYAPFQEGFGREHPLPNR